MFHAHHVYVSLTDQCTVGIVITYMEIHVHVHVHPEAAHFS